jgi:hypothetical protein
MTAAGYHRRMERLPVQGGIHVLNIIPLNIIAASK